MSEWARLASTTIADYMKGVEEKLGTHNKLYALLKKAGQIKYNCTGDGFKWQVEYREVPLIINNGEQAITPKREDYVKQCSLDYIGYLVDDSMSKREKLKNASGPSQLVNYIEEMAKRLERNAIRRFTEEFYVDSGASGNTGRMSGIETIMATNGTCTITQSTTGSVASRSANAADVAGYPSVTYAGISTILNNYGGSWTFPSTGTISSCWPAGVGDLTTDFFSPVVVCYNSTAWAGSTNTWADNCLKATRYLITHMQRYNFGPDDSVTKVMLDRDLYRQFLDKQDSKEHAYVESNYSLRAMGFEDVFQQDGCEITWEWGVPSGVGYGFNIKNMELRSMQDRLWEISDIEFARLNNMYYVVGDFHGQMKFGSPNRFAKLITIAA